ncbi:MAG: chitobiase/beta-hexosaminidase C-terminal domain-containing protein, partial [Chitinivibrionales bacterium]|nr:chitobiase/beta-hexosaminidase C-terminal domain-containing protein [Chitinivibrionales bacterium]
MLKMPMNVAKLLKIGTLVSLILYCGWQEAAADREAKSQPRILQSKKGVHKAEIILSPVDSLFSSFLYVTITKKCSHPCCDQAAIYYTVDGSNPLNSPHRQRYTQPLTLYRTTLITIGVRGDSCGLLPTVIQKKFVSIEPLPVPIIVPASGRVAVGDQVSIFVPGFEHDTSVRVYYTLSGSDPSVAGKRYLIPLYLTASVHLRAVAISSTGR